MKVKMHAAGSGSQHGWSVVPLGMALGGHQYPFEEQSQWNVGIKKVRRHFVHFMPETSLPLVVQLGSFLHPHGASGTLAVQPRRWALQAWGQTPGFGT